MKRISRQLGIIAFLVCSLASCKSKEKVAVNPLPQEIVSINDHFYNDDLNALIKDYEAYPQYQDYIYELIFIDYDFSAMSYEELFFLKESNTVKANSDIYVGFSELLKGRELDLTNQLQYMSLDSLYLYHMRYPIRRGFVEEFLDTTIVRALPELEYPEIKYLANLFDGTLIGEKMRKIQHEQKFKKTTIIEDLNEYVLREIASLDILREEIELYAMQSAFDNLEIFMEKMMKDDFPKREKEVIKIVNKLIIQTMSAQVERHVANKVLEYVNEINDVRKSSYISLSDDSVKAIATLKEELFVNYDSINLPQYRIKYNPEPLYLISKKQNRRDWIGGALTIISLFDPTGITDVIDLTYGVGSTIKVQNDIKKQNLKFINDFAEAIKESSRGYSEKVTGAINEELVKSHEIFKSEIYEIY